jgi:hypothetical protein
VVEATVSVGIVAKAADQDIDELVLAIRTEEDKMFYEALVHIEEEQLKVKTDKEVTTDEHIGKKVAAAATYPR